MVKKGLKEFYRISMKIKRGGNIGSILGTQVHNIKGSSRALITWKSQEKQGFCRGDITLKRVIHACSKDDNCKDYWHECNELSFELLKGKPGFDKSSNKTVAPPTHPLLYKTRSKKKAIALSLAEKKSHECSRGKKVWFVKKEGKGGTQHSMLLHKQPLFFPLPYHTGCSSSADENDDFATS